MPQNPVLAEARRLHQLGFAIHWLHPQSKRPIDFKWTMGPRKDWGDLAKAYKPGMNVGVRLGYASEVGEKRFLAAVDCDVKSDDPRHQAEMLAKVKDLFPGLNVRATASVASGRGNGSCHYYVTTGGEAVTPARLAQSPEKVKVKMPSVAPSRADRLSLTKDEIDAGFHLRPAWEISIMGEGQQVVLPPSVHPDTRKAYRWNLSPADAAQIAPVAFGGSVRRAGEPKVKNPELARNGDFHPLMVDIIGSGLPSSIVDLILTGEGCTDKSASLYLACVAMVKEGFNDDQILTVLTDPDTHLGDTGFKHAQTTSRGHAAKWVRKYTLLKARRECDPRRDFDAVEDQGAKKDDGGDDDDPFSGAGGGDGLDDWVEKIERTDAKSGMRPKNTLKNCVTILSGVFGRRVFARDLFANRDIYGRDTPWGGVAGGEINNAHLVQIKLWFASQWRFEPGKDRVLEAVISIADNNAFHPVRDYVNALTWDGVKRVDTWLKDYVAADGPTDYLAAVGRKFLVAMIARVFKPGCKFDYVMIWEGRQGIGKSTAASVLGGKWFSDAAMNFADKDGVLSSQGVWLRELGELSGMRKADADMMKEFISRTEDRIRPPYGMLTECYPRQMVPLGTTNGKEYLKDQTGNRRFWPVSVGECDTDALRADRDQLFAEAKLLFDAGEGLYLADAATAAMAQEEQDKRLAADTWADKIDDLIRKMAPGDPEIILGDLFEGTAPFADERDTPANIHRVVGILLRKGFSRTRITAPEGGRRWVYRLCNPL